MNTTYPKHSALTRSTIPDPDSPEIQELLKSDPAAYAASHLGYAHPSHAKAKIAQGKLAREMRLAGVRPFEEKSVSSYKVKKARVPCFGRFFQYFLLPPPAICFLVAFASLAVNSLLLAIGKAFSIDWLANATWAIQSTIVYSAGASFIVTLIVTYLSEKIETKEGKWDRSDISGYAKEIPLFALETMQEIHMRCPEAQFWVEEMHVEKRLVDPFLGVTDPETKRDYYLEVWDEPDFKAVRTA